MGTFLLRVIFALSVGVPALCAGPMDVAAQSSSNSALTPLQREIETQRARLGSADIEIRRDAVVHLGNLKRAESSRVAAVALRDPEPIVRATAAHAVLSLPANEAVTTLSPLLNEKSEFVRQQVAYALGQTRSVLAVQLLVASLTGDKADSVRGAAAVALGEIADASAVFPLAGILDRDLMAVGQAKSKKSTRKKENEFVARVAARALGQIGNRAAVPALAKVLSDETGPDDLRREAAAALGQIGDASAEPALRSVSNAPDPHLTRIARESLARIQRGGNRPPP